MKKTTGKGKTSQQKKVTITFDVGMLNVLIKYCLCDFIPKSQIQTLYKLMKEIDPSLYKESDVMDRIIILKTLTEAIIERNITDMELLKYEVGLNSGDSASVLSKISFERNQITASDAEAVANAVEERLQTIYIYESKQAIIDDLMALESIRCLSYHNVIAHLKENLSNLLGNLMSTERGNSMIRAFGFSDSNFQDNIDKIVKNAKKPTSILQTGIQYLNAILSPGFQGGRLYTFLGCTGKFKSGTLINIADQIRLFNPQIKAVENGLRKTILFITLENTINETIERLLDMYSGIDDDILDMSTEDVINILKEEGKFVFTDTDGIDIDIRYYGNLEIRVNDIYTIERELRESGKEPICIILDYIARIESNSPNGGDERIRISQATKNLKTMAQELNIPIITAMQVNREGNAVLDAAMRENKQDLARLIGAAAVGMCWDLIQESDWVCFVYPERQVATGQLFLSFKRLKVRGKKYRKLTEQTIKTDYFNHPFTNEKEIKLLVDVDKPIPASIISLKTDLSNDDANAIEMEERFKKRPRLVDLSSSKQNKLQNTIHAVDLSNIEKLKK